MENFLDLSSKRIGRSAYALRLLCFFLVAVFIIGPMSNFDFNQIPPLGGVIALILSCYMLLIDIQRLNDLNLSRWYVLLAFVPLIGFFFMVAMLARKGVDYKNATTSENQKTITAPRKYYSPQTQKEIDREKEVSSNLNTNDIKYCRQCGKKQTKDLIKKEEEENQPLMKNKSKK